VAFLSLILACVVLARRFAGAGERGWAIYSVATAAACLALTAWPSLDGISVRLAVAMVVGPAWVSATAVKWRRQPQRQGIEKARRP
jgi:hypothetical protein